MSILTSLRVGPDGVKHVSVPAAVTEWMGFGVPDGPIRAVVLLQNVPTPGLGGLTGLEHWISSLWQGPYRKCQERKGACLSACAVGMAVAGRGDSAAVNGLRHATRQGSPLRSDRHSRRRGGLMFVNITDPIALIGGSRSGCGVSGGQFRR